jgi:threonine/homoserine/homoserine lactone efflux protein
MIEFLISVVIGLALSAPLGPIGILCLNYALSKGFRSALLAGLGAAAADTFYVGIAAFSLGTVSHWFLENSLYLGLFGGTLLLLLGYRIATNPLDHEKKEVKNHSFLTTFASTFFFTLSNPFTLLVAASLIGCLIPHSEGRSNAESATIVAGIFVGCMLWWTLLALIGRYFRNHLGLSLLRRIKKSIGIAVILFGLFFIGWSLR